MLLIAPVNFPFLDQGLQDFNMSSVLKIIQAEEKLNLMFVKSDKMTAVTYMYN